MRMSGFVHFDAGMQMKNLKGRGGYSRPSSCYCLTTRPWELRVEEEMPGWWLLIIGLARSKKATLNLVIDSCCFISEAFTAQIECESAG